MRQYLELLKDILENGVEKEDRTGVGTKSLFGRQFRIDLSKGFPLLTTKKLFLKGIVTELTWFLKGDTNTKYLNDRGVKIWNDWSDENGDLPNIYGKQWRRWETFSDEPILVKVREPDDSLATPPEIIKVESDPDDDFVGKIFPSNECGKFQVKKRLEAQNGNRVYLVQFCESLGTAVVMRPNLRRGQVKDPHSRTAVGVGYLGNGYKDLKYEDRLYNLWRSMLGRCYNKKYKQYKLYGGRGVTVSDEWHCFADFVRTISQVPFYSYWKNNPTAYELDKDYFGANQYSKKTTIFLRRRDNIALVTQTGKAFRVGDRLFVSQWELARFLDIHGQYVSHWVLTGENKYGTFDDVEIVEPPPGYVYRKRRLIDQIDYVINEIKTNPDSRRLVVSAWNPIDLPDMALPPCHALFQFFVHDGKLSCQLYQRSVDAMLGLPYNIASYALLTMMIAQVTGLEPGEFVHTSGDLHIYNNHTEQAKIQLAREPRPLSQMKINPEVKSIDDFEYEDFELIGYDPYPHIRCEIAV